MPVLPLRATGPAVKRQRILKQPGRRPVIAPGVHLPDKRSQPHRQSCSPKEENHEHRPAERYGRKRQCTETPHHRVIEQLHDHLPDLRKHDGNGQRKVLTVLGQPAPQSSQKSHTKKSRHLRREAKDTVFDRKPTTVSEEIAREYSYTTGIVYYSGDGQTCLRPYCPSRSQAEPLPGNAPHKETPGASPLSVRPHKRDGVTATGARGGGCGHSKKAPARPSPRY